MKNKPVVIVLAIIAAALIIYMSFGIKCVQEKKDQKDLTVQIDQLSPILSAEIATPEDLAKRLADAEARLAAQKEVLPAKISNAEVVEAIVKLAGENHVKAIPLNADPVSAEKVEEIEYRVLKVRIQAEGNQSDLLAFIGMLEGGTIKTLAVNNVELSRVESVQELRKSQELQATEQVMQDIQKLLDLQQSPDRQAVKEALRKSLQELAEELQTAQQSPETGGLMQQLQDTQDLLKQSGDIKQLPDAQVLYQESIQDIQQLQDIQGLQNVANVPDEWIWNASLDIVIYAQPIPAATATPNPT